MSPSVKEKAKEAQNRFISWHSFDTEFIVIITVQSRAYFYIMRKFFNSNANDIVGEGYI